MPDALCLSMGGHLRSGHAPSCPPTAALRPLALALVHLPSCRRTAVCKPHCKPISARRLTIGYRKKGGGAKGVARTPLRSQAPLPFHFLLCPSPCVSSEQAGKLEFFHVPAKISLLARPVCLTWLQLIIDIPDSAVTIRQSLFAPM